MVVSKNKIVSLTYELRVGSKDGELIETVNSSSPLTFLYGSGLLLPKFEDYLAGLKIGDSFDFNLPSKDAYGEIDENSVIKIPLKSFEIDGKVDYEMVKTGNQIPMQDSQGNRLNGIVREISDESVTMDFNHPLAGNHLFFTGEVTEVRQATEEELQHGHVHQQSSCGGCSGCGEENEGCCS